MAGHEEEDYMRDVDTHNTEGFVTGVQDLDDLDISDREVTYRRADFGTRFLTSHFDALDRTEFANHGKTPVQFAAVSHSVDELDDDDAVFSPAFAAPTIAPVASSAPSLENAMPTGDVPDAREVGYHRVNPSFESETAPSEIFAVLLKALRDHDVVTTTRADWTCDVMHTAHSVESSECGFNDVALRICLGRPSADAIEAFALVAAEEVVFTVQLHRLASRNVIRIDFNLASGDEMLFLATTDKIRKDCRAIDLELQGLPDLSFDLFLDWSDTHAELFPSALPVDEQALQLLIDDVTSESALPATRYEAAKSLKDLCQLPRNRTAVATDMKHAFVDCLDAMLRDDDEDIVRFAIFAIQTFERDASLRAQLEFPDLSDKLRTISSSSTKRSTKQLADDLLRALVSPVS